MPHDVLNLEVRMVMFSPCLTVKKSVWNTKAEEIRERFVGLSKTQMMGEI